MESRSIVDASPSFNSHSSNNLPDIADRVVQELRTDNGLGDDIFDFGVENNLADTGEYEGVMTNTPTGKLKGNEEDAPNEDEIEFEFPVVCRDSNLFPVSTDDVLTDNQISPTYPLFDRSLLLDVDPNSSNGVDTSGTDPKPSPAARHSLMMLFREDHSAASSSSSEADDLDRITPGTYCIWKPKTESHGMHKKSNSISFDNNSKPWKVRDLLKRSYSDDNYSARKEASVVLFTPPIATKQKINSAKVKKTEKTAKLTSVVDGGGTYRKPESNIPVHKAKAGGNRLPPYLPYRPDQHGLASFTGFSRNLYRY